MGPARRASNGTLSAALILHAAILLEMHRGAEAVEAGSAAIVAAETDGHQNARFRALCLQVQALENSGRREKAVAQAKVLVANLPSAEDDDANYLDDLLQTLIQIEALEELNLVARPGLELFNPVRDGASWWSLRGVLWEALRRRGQLSQAVELATTSVQLANTQESRPEAVRALAARAMSLLELGEHATALTDVEAGEVIALSIDVDGLVVLFGRLRLRAAARVAVPNVVEHYARMLKLSDATSSTLDPTRSIGLLFVAVARVERGGPLDALLRREYGRFAEGDKPLYVYDSDGAEFAHLVIDIGRAKAYKTAAELLPRLAAFVALLPSNRRDRQWLTDIIVGFATNCRDSGVLRDVATLMKPALDPTAESAAELLELLAAVDEASDPERFLARIDPDLATLVRRLRGLPSPTVTPRRSRKRLRRLPG